MVRFSKYEFYNKLLDDITLFRVTPVIIWTQPIYIGQNGHLPLSSKINSKMLIFWNYLTKYPCFEN